MDMRDYRNIDRYLDELLADIYVQPPDAGHTEMAREVIQNWFPQLLGIKTVLDVGCGQGFCQEIFEELGLEYTGITLGEDYQIAKASGKNVLRADFTFMDIFPDDSFDVIFSRHSLEHSPMPLLTLMEFERVAKTYLCLVLPRPAYFTWAGRNHYSLMSVSQARFLLGRAGWTPIWEDFSDNREFRFMCSKSYRVYGGFNDSTLEYEEVEYASSDEVRYIQPWGGCLEPILSGVEVG